MTTAAAPALASCWVCLCTDTAIHERIGGARCVDSGPCEARQLERLGRERNEKIARLDRARERAEMEAAFPARRRRTGVAR